MDTYFTDNNVRHTTPSRERGCVERKFEMALGTSELFPSTLSFMNVSGSLSQMNLSYPPSPLVGIVGTKMQVDH
jgi:hypothetical protein